MWRIPFRVHLAIVHSAKFFTGGVVVPDLKARRLALVIGNGAYKVVPALKNPPNDAAAISKKLTELGFEVQSEIDSASDRMVRAIGEFIQKLGEANGRGASVAAVIFYAGHGVQVEGENFLLPIDSEVRTRFDLQHRAVALDLVLEALSSAAHTSVVLLDCCRDNPIPRTLVPASRSAGGGAQGLANVRAPKGVFIAYATQPHFVALDGTGDNSPFTEALLQFIGSAGKSVSDVLMDVRRVVYETTKGQQIPWDHSALFEPFRFSAGDITKIGGLSEEDRQRVLQAEAEAREGSYWQVIQKSTDVSFIHSFVTQYPNSKYRADALARIDLLKAKAQWRRTSLWIGGMASALFLAFLSFLWFGKETLADTNILSGDIENQGLYGFENTLDGCRLRCVLDRFDRPCVAFSYDQSPDPSITNRCYPKYEAVFFFKPSKYNAPKTVSEIMPHVLRSRPKPVETVFTTLPERLLIGEAIPANAVRNLLSSSSEPVEDLIEHRRFWQLRSGGECQKVCTDLPNVCKGFSYSRALSRCELFQAVKGLVRDSFNGRPVTVPGMLSACNDPNARSDAADQDPSKPDILINECLIRRQKTP